MIALDNSEFSVDVVEHDGEFVYRLLDGFDEVLVERVAGSAYTSSEEGMREIGQSMLQAVQQFVQPGATPPIPRRLIINITSPEMKELQAANLVTTTLKLKPKARYDFKFKDGRNATVYRRVYPGNEIRYTVRFV